MTFLSHIFDFIFPRECHLCGCSLSSQDKFVCSPCLSKLPRTLYHRVKDNAMERRFMGQFPYRAATGHFFYSRGSELATLIHDFKYHRFPDLAAHLGSIVADELIVTGFLSDIDFILPVPMHFLKKSRRGYNQTEEIARGISSRTGIPVSKLLRAVRPHPTQTSLSLENRIKNTEGIFKVNNPELLKDKSVLIVDDVCTTGATLGSAARVIVDSVPGVEITLLTLGVTF